MIFNNIKNEVLNINKISQTKNILKTCQTQESSYRVQPAKITFFFQQKHLLVTNTTEAIISILFKTTYT